MVAHSAPRIAPEFLSRPSEANSVAPARPPERTRPRRAGAEVRAGIKGVLSAIISPTARRVSRAETLGEPRAGRSGARRSPRRTARARKAGADIERRPAMAARPIVSKVAGETSNSTRLLRLSKGTPDLELGLDVPDHLVGELPRSGGPSQFRSPVPLQDRLEGRLVDRA